MLDATRTVADLMLEQPARARALERLRIDYCCGGGRSLAEACAERGIAVAEAVAALEAAGGEPEHAWPADGPLGALCDHIVEAHHGRLREELPRLSELLAKVERAHAADHPEAAELRRAFESVRRELEEHMADEEERLFPAIRAGERFEASFVQELEAEHAATGEGLERMRELGGGYELERAWCNTHRATLEALRELELDLHRHIHEENNVLFPRALARA